MKYILSIVIPTKNRSYYCLYAVKQILSLKMSDVEICIQDNSDTDDLSKELSQLNTENIVYNYHPGVLSFVDNFSEAVSLAHGDYLCMIGDDDGILPVIMNLVEDMKKQNAEAAIPALNFIYFWPSNQGIIENGDNGVLISHISSEYKMHSGKQVNNGKAIIELLKNGIQNYTSFDMPRLYHGVVRRDALERIKEQTGCFFGGLTPDMYMATSLSLVCNKVIRVSYSVTISGICPTSGSSDSATGKHTGELGQAPHFRGHDHYHWDDLVPAFYSVDTIWADTLFHTLREFKRDDLFKFFNMSLFAGLCVEKYPEYSNVILNHAFGYQCSINGIKFELYKYKFEQLLLRAIRKIRRSLYRGIGKTTTKELNIGDIFAAQKRIMELQG